MAMTTHFKRWTALGLGLTLGGLVACDQQEPSQPALDQTTAEMAKTVPAMQGGEGEGGVAFDRAATDRVEFLSALAITDAHIYAGRDAYLAGNREAAGEMLAHPVSEVLADMEPAFEARGVTPFYDVMIAASEAILNDAPRENVLVAINAALRATQAARAKAPEADFGDVRVEALVIADQLDRAADMYPIAVESGRFEPYLDGYGFLVSAEMLYKRVHPALAEDAPRVDDAIAEAIAMLGEAYPSADMPAVLSSDPAELLSMASKVRLALGA